MAKRGYYDEVRRRVAEQGPDLSRLLSYEEIVEQYGERLRALGIGVRSAGSVQGTLRSLTSRGIIHRYEQGGRVKIPANEIEILLDVLEEPRPLLA